ncbi:diguanylate cyclase [Planococcus glaciei]|uniref:EAL domain-containing protein n=1 Tax=Planococcus glaciei TaxID=459472 RepID=A0A7H8Q891_9BACL|nr:bifunctional diguanylate cyclase/phosphodiesterase [Planococcus glaciei]ETP70094.1 diguanylate cyclase [Planococcus glaciei CHR43]KOF12250.1 diguanylate cyclase [Planococcus glaciei]MBX0314296.1 EAL domain-containing protein [Planococcus glaciei]QDY44938.1 EAL domain-containing protein [Planococcus glaciei]QKX49712.1 EAL domain-containing protein [Planococcus glaciei]
MSELQDLLSNNLVFNHIPFPIIIMDKDGLVVWCNRHAERVFQVESSSIKGQLYPYMNPEKAALYKHSWETILHSKEPVRFEDVEVGLGTGGHTYTTIVTKAFAADGEQFIMSIFEVDEADEEGSASRELNSLRNGLDDSFMLLYFDEDFLITYANPLFLKLSKWTPKRILGKPIWQMFGEAGEDVHFVETLTATLKNGKVWNGQAKKLKKDGDVYWVDLTAIPMQVKGDDTYYIFLEKDITASKNAQHHLEAIAFIDPITGLENRHRLEQVVNEFIEERKHFSFVYMDIDRFYTLQDVSDTDTENELLVEFTKRLRMYFSDSIITRAGLHEFALVTPLSNWFIEGFLHYLQQHPIYMHGTAIPLTVSGAITRYPEDQQSFVHLIKASHATIKKVKERGGSAISALTSDDHERLNRTSLIERRLIHALDRRNLRLLYQPQVNLSTGKVEGVEALVRWEDSEIGIVTPDELIPIAEESGMIHEIGRFVLETVCAQQKEWKSRGIDLNVSINSSIREFRDKDMAKVFLEQLALNEGVANSLTIEITEKFALEAEAEQSIIKQMKQLHQAGISFSLDDFGTGYASFRYMLLLPISSLKIDRDIIQSITKQEKMQKMIKGMIQFGKSLDFQVTAEGVETNEQLELLRAMDCDIIQGYISGRPMEAHDLEKWLN